MTKLKLFIVRVTKVRADKLFHGLYNGCEVVRALMGRVVKQTMVNCMPSGVLEF